MLFLLMSADIKHDPVDVKFQLRKGTSGYNIEHLFKRYNCIIENFRSSNTQDITTLLYFPDSDEQAAHIIVSGIEKYRPSSHQQHLNISIYFDPTIYDSEQDDHFTLRLLVFNGAGEESETIYTVYGFDNDVIKEALLQGGRLKETDNGFFTFAIKEKSTK